MARRGSPARLRWLPAALLAAAVAAGLAAATLDLVPVPRPEPGLLEDGVRRELAAAHGEIDRLLQTPGTAPETLAGSFGGLGRLYAAYELYEAAAAGFENARRLATGDFRWPYYLAYVEMERGGFRRAVDLLEEALALEPDDLPARLRLGAARFALGEVEEARAAYERALAVDPAAAAAHAGLGKVLAARGEHREAVRRFERALALQPGATLLHYPLAQALRRLGRTEDARRHLARAGEEPVAFADPLIDELTAAASGGALAKFHGDQAVLAGRLDEAAAAYRRAVAAAPHSFAYRKSLGSTLYHLGRVDEARKQLQAALELEPEGRPADAARQRSEIHHALGGIAANRGHLDEAVRRFRAATGLDPDWASPWFDLGNALGRSRRLEEAQAAFARALEVDPDHAEALLQRSTTLMDLGRFAEAVPLLERRLELVPGDERARWLLGIARERAGAAP